MSIIITDEMKKAIELIETTNRCIYNWKSRNRQNDFSEKFNYKLQEKNNHYRIYGYRSHQRRWRYLTQLVKYSVRCSWPALTNNTRITAIQI